MACYIVNALLQMPSLSQGETPLPSQLGNCAELVRTAELSVLSELAELSELCRTGAELVPQLQGSAFVHMMLHTVWQAGQSSMHATTIHPKVMKQ